jgi:hypothetical protein
MSPLALYFPLTPFKPGTGFGTFFSPKRLALSAFHNEFLGAAMIRTHHVRILTRVDTP